MHSICIYVRRPRQNKDDDDKGKKVKKEGHSCGIIGNTDIQMVVITVIHVLDILLVCSIDRMRKVATCDFFSFLFFVPHFLFTQVNSRKKRECERERIKRKDKERESGTRVRKRHTQKKREKTRSL